MGIALEMMGGGVLGAGAGMVLGSAGGAAAGYGVECASRTYLGSELGFNAVDGAVRGGVAGIGFGFGKGVQAVMGMQDYDAQTDNSTGNETER